MIRNCDWCGIEYEAKTSRSKSCSRKCSDNLYNNKSRDKENKHYNKRKCINCKMDFKTRSSSRFECYDCTEYKNKIKESFKETKEDLFDINRVLKNCFKGLKELEIELNKIKCCVICKKEYHLNNGLSYKYCSEKCKKKKKYKIKNRSNVSKDKRIRKNGKPDYSISLDRLIERYGTCCHICGEETNRNDFYIHTDGKTIVCGDSYPSIDHVIPIAKGGLHQWNNVKLAHRICNSIKKDKIFY